ncbi:meiotic recombination protein Rec7 [Schizosaccharomyces octosporus yFS286]|uniref:Meiotic recombination protein Rec7 n=1 Tax=Schizosaccharomyces octosporus (strain yFS286) TaxID=483514 RepID=S9Q1V5_SCHOY|nr:meiotic recombination protein Rec7 [Schizosaccharomyces octosporus yFS286]EPX73683.1 meiotic recombination protein Rec7 [Schizosaccharomyces octosporus yFS286]
MNFYPIAKYSVAQDSYGYESSSTSWSHYSDGGYTMSLTSGLLQIRRREELVQSLNLIDLWHQFIPGTKERSLVLLSKAPCMNFRIYSNNVTKRFQVKFPSDVFYMKAKLEIENLGLYFKDARSSSEKKQMSSSQSHIGNSQEMYMAASMNAGGVHASSQPTISVQTPTILSQTIPATPPVAAPGGTVGMGGGMVAAAPPAASSSSSSQGAMTTTTNHVAASEMTVHTPYKRARVDEIGSMGYSQIPASTPSAASSSSGGVLTSIRPSQNGQMMGRQETNMESIQMSQPAHWEDGTAISSSPYHPSQYSMVAATPLGSQNPGIPIASLMTPMQENPAPPVVTTGTNSSYMNMLPSPPTTSSPSTISANHLTEEEKLLRDKVLFYLQQSSFLQLCQSLDRIWTTMQHA